MVLLAVVRLGDDAYGVTWFWKQMLIAIAIRILASLRQHWQHLAFALTGTLPTLTLENSMFRVLTGIPRWELSWPWSMLVFEGTFHLLVPLDASPILITGLLVRRQFRWVGLFRTLLPPPARPVYLPRPWSASFHLIATVPGFLLLAPAYLGCRSPRHTVNWKQETP